MEIHHQHHHDPPQHKEKPWKHYAIEFLMLFLAVTLGFYSETLRESIVERSREKEYMESLVQDIQADTTNLRNEILLGKKVSAHLQHLNAFLNADSATVDQEKLYQLQLGVGRVVKFRAEDRTAAQLKNAGNMRLIRNKAVSDSILNYWMILSVLDEISGRLDYLRGNASETADQLFDNRYVRFSDPLHPLHSEVTVLPNAKLISEDKALLALYSNRRTGVWIVLNNYISSMEEAQEAAIHLIDLIRKEYHLE